MAHRPGLRSESGPTWSAIAAWKRCQPRGGMCPRVSRLSVDNSVALCPWAPFSTSITTFKNMFCGWQVINQQSVDEQMRGELRHSIYVTTQGKGRLWTAWERSQKQFTAANYSFPKRGKKAMNGKERLCHHHCTQMAIMETMIVYKWIQLWVCYSHTSSGSVASPAQLFGRLKANKMLLTAPQLLIKHTSHTGKYKQMTAAQEGATGGG